LIPTDKKDVSRTVNNCGNTFSVYGDGITKRLAKIYSKALPTKDAYTSAVI